MWSTCEHFGFICATLAYCLNDRWISVPSDLTMVMMGLRRSRNQEFYLKKYGQTSNRNEFTLRLYKRRRNMDILWPSTSDTLCKYFQVI